MEALFLFLILLSGLILASFLGTNEGYRNHHNFVDGSFNSDRVNNDNANSLYASLKSKASAYYDNYNHYTGTTASSLTLQNGLVFTDAVGDTVTVSTNSNGLQRLELSQPENSATMVLNQSSTDTNLFNAPFGNVNATVVTDSNNQVAIQINLPNGETIVFTQAGTNTNTDANTSSTQYYGSTGSTIPQSNYAYQGSASANQYYGPYGGTAGSITGPAGNTLYYAQGPYGNTVAGIQQSQNGPYYNNNTSSSANQYYGPYGGTAGSITGPAGNTAYYAQGPNGNTVVATQQSQNGPYYNNNTSSSANQYYGPNGGSAGSITGPAGNTAYYAEGPNGNTVTGTSDSGTSNYGTDYYNTLPQGVSKSQIPPGQEDAYILKSEIVPPVCPACSMTPASASANCPRQEPCPPCPACARCPEPSFECKKVPNYSSINEDSLPMPVLSDFSQFGM